MRECLSNVVAIVIACALIGCGGTVPETIATKDTTKTEQHTTATPEAAPHYGTGPGTDTGAKNCGDEIYGTPDISCPFARNVRRAFFGVYESTHVEPRHVTAYSPVTHKTYRLNCAIINTGDAECATKTGAVVSFPVEHPQSSNPAGETPSKAGRSESGEVRPTERGSAEGDDEVGSTSHEGDETFCEEHRCIGKFTTEEGMIVECADGAYSHAGGISGACSDHGGVAKE